jgi:hypothetical protein
MMGTCACLTPFNLKSCGDLLVQGAAKKLNRCTFLHPFTIIIFSMGVHHLEVFTLPLVFRSESDRTARTPRTVLGLSSDYFWLRGLPNIYCESEPVRTESEQSPSDYSESSDSLQTRLRTESDHIRPQSDSTGNLLEFKKYLLP